MSENSPTDAARAAFPPVEIIGHAIVSEDGMIAGPDRKMPAGLQNDADWRRFQQALNRAALTVLGSLGHRAHPNHHGRRRLVATSTVRSFETDPNDALSTLWNPGAISFAGALEKLGIDAGLVAIVGGQRVFDYFRPFYTQFDLVEAERVIIPGGVTCFSGGSPRAILTRAGMLPGTSRDLDKGVRLTVWTRQGRTP